MAEAEIARHVEEAQSRWPLLGVTVIHRYGRIAPGENIVLVSTASSHRQAAFAAAEFLMDYLKTHAPFWKQVERGRRDQLGRGQAVRRCAAERWREPSAAPRSRSSIAEAARGARRRDVVDRARDMLPSQRSSWYSPPGLLPHDAASWSPLPVAAMEAGRAAVARKGRPWTIDPGLASHAAARACAPRGVHG